VKISPSVCTARSPPEDPWVSVLHCQSSRAQAEVKLLRSTINFITLHMI